MYNEDLTLIHISLRFDCQAVKNWSILFIDPEYTCSLLYVSQSFDLDVFSELLSFILLFLFIVLSAITSAYVIHSLKTFVLLKK